MPSTRFAVALTALVVLAGCSMVPGVGGGGPPQTTTRDAPEHHGLVFASHTGGVPFNATVTVAKDGEPIYERSISSDGNGTYAGLTQLSEPGPYTVTVNTTIPGVGGGTMSERFTVNGSLGNATVVRVSYQGIYQYSLRLPRADASYRMGVLTDHPRIEGELRVWYQGERVVDASFSVNESDRAILDGKLVELNGTGVYRVAVNTGDGWTSQTVVVPSPDHRIVLRFDFNGRLERVEVRVAYEERER